MERPGAHYRRRENGILTELTARTCGSRGPGTVWIGTTFHTDKEGNITLDEHGLPELQGLPRNGPRPT